MIPNNKKFKLTEFYNSSDLYVPNKTLATSTKILKSITSLLLTETTPQGNTENEGLGSFSQQGSLQGLR